MKSPKHQNIYEQICDFMGEDLDAHACKEVADHLEIAGKNPPIGADHSK